MTITEVLNEIRDACYVGHDAITIQTRESGDEGDQPIHKAVVQGNIEYVKVLIDAGSDPNSIGDMGITPLHAAASRGMVHIVSFLLDHGADPSAKNDFNRTPIDAASEPDLKQLLIAAAAKPADNKR